MRQGFFLVYSRSCSKCFFLAKPQLDEAFRGDLRGVSFGDKMLVLASGHKKDPPGSGPFVINPKGF